MAKIVTFVKVGNRVTVTDDGNKIGLRGELNVLQHPIEDAVIITPHVNAVTALSGINDSLVFNVSDVTVPLTTNKAALVTALQSIFV